MIDATNKVSAQQLEEQHHIGLGERVRDLRKSYGVTQTELGEMIGCSNETISYLEHGGQYAPRVWMIAAIAQVFGVTVDYLIGLDQEGGR